MRCLVVAVFVASACVTPGARLCDNGLTCPEALVCDELNGGCVEPGQLTACAGMVDRAECTAPTGPGTCHNEVCLEAGCGNGRLDRVEDEVCDDGNQKDGDDCSADCTSTLVCGNGTIDLSEGERCDDGNAVSSDGCDSTCGEERVRWIEVVPPTNSLSLLAAYDAARGKVVLYDSLELRVMEWDGRWQPRPTLLQPPPRTAAAMVYDHARREVILHGGSSQGSGALADTWAWNGSEWRQIATGPTAQSHAMAYDAGRERVVLFGGFDNSGEYPTKTYELVGSTWSEVAAATLPPPRVDARMAYDPKRGVVVLVGGRQTQVLDDVWELDGTTWTDRTPAAGNVAGVTSAGFTWDARRQALVLFGGHLANDTDTNTMSFWNGATWTPYVGTRPTARSMHVLVEADGQLLVFGGVSSGSLVSATTQLFDGSSWSVAANGPVARSEMVGANAPTQQRYVAFGGDDAATGRQTWELSRRGWKMIGDGTGSAPPQLGDERIVFDAARNVFVLFGGRTIALTQPTAVWELSASNVWTSVTPANGPEGRSHPVLVYDAARGETVMYGGAPIVDIMGSPTYVPVSDMWTWNGITWTEKQPATSPGTRFGAAAGYDPITQTVVMFSGAGDGATFVWDGTDWTRIDTPVHPPDRLFGSLVWDPARRSLVLTGGSVAIMDAWEWIGHPTSPPSGEWRAIPAGLGPAPRVAFITGALLDGSGVFIEYGRDATDTNLVEPWMIQWSGESPTESCRSPEDRDGDGRAGCDDDDCWATCSPSCPPGVACTVPDTCGNGTCEPTDSCGLCPGDCPSTCAAVCGDFVCATGESCPGDCPP